MADAKKCDRCCKFYMNYENIRFGDYGKANYITINHRVPGSPTALRVKTVELCPECMKEFLNWYFMKEEEEEEEENDQI